MRTFGDRLAYVRAVEKFILHPEVAMWSFSYTGRGIADASSEAEAQVLELIQASAERQLKETPERAHKHIRTAADYVKAVARLTNSQVSIVAEGWIEEDGQAAATVHVSIVGMPAEAGAPGA